MPKNNKNYYLEVNALFTLLVAYTYYKMHKEEQYNDPYNYPIKTTYNWTPTMLSSMALLLSSVASTILALNPERSNFHLSQTQKYLDTGFKMAEGLLPLATKYGFKAAKIIAGDRADAVQDVAENAITYIEQGFRFLATLNEVHAHQYARSFVAPANAATGEEETRYLSRTAHITHNIDKAFILSVESAVSIIWNSGAYRILNKYFNMEDKDTVTSLNTLYLLADLIKLIGTSTINNLSLATEIVIYGEDKSKYYKIEEPELIKAIKSFAHNILEGIREAKEELNRLKNQLIENAKEIANKLAENMHLKEMSEAVTKELDDLKETFRKLGEQFELKAHELAEKLKEVMHFKEIAEAAESLKNAISDELQEAKSKVTELTGQLEEKLQKFAETIAENLKLKAIEQKFEHFGHFCGDQLKAMEDQLTLFNQKAAKIQARVRGNIDRTTNEKAIAFIVKKSAAKAVIGDASKEHEIELDVVAAQTPSIAPAKSPALSNNEDQPKSSDHHRSHSITDAFERIGDAVSSAFHIPGHSKPKAEEKSASAAAADSKSQDKSGEKTSGTAPKKDHADLSEKELNFAKAVLISLLAQKIAEVILAFKPTSEENVPETQNEERKEYKKSIEEIEKNLQNAQVALKMDEMPILEKPANQTQSINNKAKGDFYDMAHFLAIELNSAMFVGEQGGWAYHQNEAMAM